MKKMQAEAAPTIPADAPVAAYLDQLPTAVPANLLGSLIALEAKALHQVRHDIIQALSLRPSWKLVAVCYLSSCEPLHLPVSNVLTAFQFIQGKYDCLRAFCYCNTCQGLCNPYTAVRAKLQPSILPLQWAALSR